ncbi:hypothetical protein C2845_PM09G00060 [Panicum miliaceum]|uniref:PHD-type domain-containing protein n=1 Tax=Panicum miliaceum TaxID=4540 RepID=A0A3L6RZ14_PANMI|nr:hypothetical protein C2845_PM09G00060 [Panicum miliaceum]
MKRELAFALRSLSEIPASPGRTRSGRPISSLPDPSASASLKRRKRSDPPPAATADLVSPPTPPIDAEPPTQPLRDIIEPVDGSNPPTAADHQSNSNAAQEVIAQKMLEAPQPSHAEAEDSLIAKPNVPMEECAAALDAAPTLLESTGAAGNDQCNSSNSDGGSLQLQVADNASGPAALLVEDTTTPLPAAELKPARRFTRSLLKNKPDKEDSAASVSQATPDGSKEASFDLALLLEKPQRRFTRSLLKTKVESSLVGSDDAHDSASDSPPPVKKMEMKMSKKVACLTKHPGNIRELLNTGLLEGMPVMYIIPHSKKAVLKGVITGCNIRCFCPSCNGSKAVSAYYFEQHAGSTKKHPADYIYLGNGNSLRDVLRASERSPLEALEKTIRSSIGPVVKGSHVNCMNCNEHVLPSSQTEHVLCQRCLESKQPQDHTTPSYPCKSNSSLTPSSKVAFLKKISSSKKGGSAGKVTNKERLMGISRIKESTVITATEWSDSSLIQAISSGSSYMVSPSAFEAHAGEGSRRKPYDNIFTSNGVSLHELAMKISKDMERSERETDDLCRECGHGGDIFPCKICPRSFHPACVGLPEAPSEWYCDNCRNLVQKEKALAENKNAKAAGRQAGVDSIEQIMKRAIRIVPMSDDLGGCALCKKKDFNNAVFDERTVILCDQCEKEYHVGCLQSQWQVELKELPEGEWFCCGSCSGTRLSLEKIISDGAQLLAEPDIEIIRMKHEIRGLCMDTSTDLKWQLLSGKRATEDGRILLSAAVPIFHQSFDPIVEAHTCRDLIPEMVHGRGPKEGMAGQDYSGMYCALLTMGSTVVSAALLRVMGGDVAELPLVATSRDVQGLGYFQALFSCIERVLISLKVKHFVLPAAHEAEGIWMNKFGFSRIPPEELEAHLNGAHLTIFQGTSYLYKAVPLPSSQEKGRSKPE